MPAAAVVRYRLMVQALAMELTIIVTEQLMKDAIALQARCKFAVQISALANKECKPAMQWALGALVRIPSVRLTMVHPMLAMELIITAMVQLTKAASV